MSTVDDRHNRNWHLGLLAVGVGLLALARPRSSRASASAGRPTPAAEYPVAAPTVERPIEGEPPRTTVVRTIPRNELRQAAILGALVLALALALLQTLGVLLRPIALLLAAIVLAAAASQPVDWLQRRLPRTLAVLLVYLLAVLVLGAIGWMVVPRLVGQATQLVQSAPQLAEQALQGLAGVVPGTREQLEQFIEPQLTRLANELGSRLISLPVTIFSSLLDIVLVVAMSIWWLLAAPSLLGFVLSLFPLERRDRAAAVLGEMNQTMGAYVRAFLIDALIVGIVSYVGLMLIGVQYAVILGLIAGVGELIPFLGPFIAAVPAIGIALLNSTGQALVVLVFYLVLQQLESNVLAPILINDQAKIPPVLVVFALVVGAALLGLLGAIVAVPVAGALRVLVIRAIAPAIRGWSGAKSDRP